MMKSEDIIRRLGDLLGPSPIEDEDQLHLIKGVVESQNGQTPNVYIGGSTTAVPVYCPGTTPITGETCWILQAGPVQLVIPSQNADTWHTPTYLNSHAAYTDYGASGVLYTWRNGVVSIQGLIAKAANSNAAFTLPALYRPELNVYIDQTTSSGAMTMCMANNGDLFFMSDTAAGWASVACTFLSGTQ